MIKVCKRGLRRFDVDWWEQWDNSCGRHEEKHYRRVCNVTDVADFDVNQFLYNTSSDYYDECDCVLYINCTVFVPELPPSGGGN